MKLQNAKGTRDLAPKDMIIRERIIGILKEMFRKYGFSPLETPVLERFDVLSSKYAGGAEILKETFKLSDQGKRDLALRYDLTVPMCRFVGMDPMMKMPFKRYQMGPVFRDGPIKLGRYREFWQCDVDTVGSKSVKAEAELLSIAADVFRKIGLDFVIKVNNRKLLNSIMLNCGISEDMIESVILTVDKLAKIGVKGVINELKTKGIDEKTSDIILKTISGSTLEELQNVLKDDEGISGLKEISELKGYIDLLDIKEAEIDFSLARGLAYYTGTVYEVFLNGSAIKSAVCAGGRYDKMIGSLLGGKQDYPAVGISFGLDVIYDAILEKEGDSPETVTDVYIIGIADVKEPFRIALELRSDGINAEVDLMGRGISKNLAYCNSKKIRYVVIVGPDEISKGIVKLKDMKSGSEKEVRRSNLAEEIRG